MGHSHGPAQRMELVRAAAIPLFRYSCCFVDWFLNDLEEIAMVWNRAYRVHLARSTSAHVLTFPTAHGGLELPLPQGILMLEQENLFLQYSSCAGSTAAMMKRWMGRDIHYLRAGSIAGPNLSLPRPQLKHAPLEPMTTLSSYPVPRRPASLLG